VLNIKFKYSTNLFCIYFVQLDESNANRLVLRSITAETAGRFRCEVSAEAPSFETVSGHADMTVVRKCRYFVLFFIALPFTSFLLFVVSMCALPPFVLNKLLYAVNSISCYGLLFCFSFSEAPFATSFFIVLTCCFISFSIP
jgi:hypothetical protein